MRELTQEELIEAQRRFDRITEIRKAMADEMNRHFQSMTALNLLLCKVTDNPSM